MQIPGFSILNDINTFMLCNVQAVFLGGGKWIIKYRLSELWLRRFRLIPKVILFLAPICWPNKGLPVGLPHSDQPSPNISY